MSKKKSRGGSRDGSGAKLKYNEPTKVISFRCPESKENEFRSVAESKLSEWLIKN